MNRIVVLLFVLYVMLSGVQVFANGDGEDGTVNLRFAIWDINQRAGMQAIADAFMADNPDIKVTLEVTSWNEYWVKLDAAARTRSLPDVFWMHVSYFQKFASNGKLLPIGEQVKADAGVLFDNYQDGLAEVYQFNGKYYAIPKDYDTIGLWYNKSLFDEAGVAYPNKNWTWNDLLTAAKKITALRDDVYGIAAPLKDQEGYYNYIYQNAGYVISPDKKKSGFNLPATKEALKFYGDLIHKYKVSPTLAQFVDIDPNSRFQSGTLGMVNIGSWQVPSLLESEFIQRNADVMYLPQQKQRASIYNGLGYSIAENTKYPKAVWRFLKYLGSREANILQAKYGAAIPAYKNTQKEWFKFFGEKYGKNVRIYADQIAWGALYPNSKTSDKWRIVLEDNMRNYLSGKTSLDDATDTIYKNMQKLLDSE